MADSTMTVRDFYKNIFCLMFLRARSPRTKYLYVSTINSFEKFLERKALVSDFNDVTVNKYLTWHRERGHTPATCNKERHNILAMWRFAYRKKILEDWPDVRSEPVPKRTPLAWTQKEIESLFMACRMLDGDYGTIPARLWWRGLLLVLWDSAERITAIMGLSWECFDKDMTWLHIPASLRKGKHEDRVYKMGTETTETLKAIRKHAKGKDVFPWPFSETYLWNRFSKLLKLAKLGSGKMSMFHRIRRSVASHYEAAGGDATELLGHSDRRVTRRHYLDPRIAPKQKPICEVLFRPTGPLRPPSE